MNTEIQQLNTLLKERDEVTMEMTARIFDFIKPTLLDTLYELFVLPYDQIEWVDVQCTQDILVVICLIDCTDVKISPFLTKLLTLAHTDTDSNPNQRHMIRIGVPVQLLFSPQEYMVEFLNRIADKAVTEDMGLLVDYEYSDLTQDQDNSFDLDQLSEEQQKQLTLFNKQKGVKH